MSVPIVFLSPGGRRENGRWPAVPRVGDLVTTSREITGEDWAYKVTEVNWTSTPAGDGVMAVVTLAE